MKFLKTSIKFVLSTVLLLSSSQTAHADMNQSTDQEAADYDRALCSKIWQAGKNTITKSESGKLPVYFLEIDKDGSLTNLILIKSTSKDPVTPTDEAVAEIIRRSAPYASPPSHTSYKGNDRWIAWIDLSKMLAAYSHNESAKLDCQPQFSAWDAREPGQKKAPGDTVNRTDQIMWMPATVHYFLIDAQGVWRRVPSQFAGITQQEWHNVSVLSHGKSYYSDGTPIQPGSYRFGIRDILRADGYDKKKHYLADEFGITVFSTKQPFTLTADSSGRVSISGNLWSEQCEWLQMNRDPRTDFSACPFGGSIQWRHSPVGQGRGEH